MNNVTDAIPNEIPARFCMVFRVSLSDSERRRVYDKIAPTIIIKNGRN